MPRLSLESSTRRMLAFYLSLSLVLSACGSATSTLRPSLTSTARMAAATEQPASTEINTPAPTPTQVAPLAILYTPPGSDPGLSTSLKPDIQKQAEGAGLRFQARSELSESDLAGGARYVLAMAPDPALQALIQASPQVHFLVYGPGKLENAPNLTIIGIDGGRLDRQGFLAGAVAAMSTGDWRVGAASITDTEAGKASLQGFLNGVTYFCGLCRPSFPPFYKYPLSVELTSTASQAEWQQAAQYMVDHQVKTVYLAPGVNDQAFIETLNQAGIHMIGSSLPVESAQADWMASVRFEPAHAIVQAWQDLLSGRIEANYSVQLNLADINPSLLSVGKQRLAQKILADLAGGYIDTGVKTSP
ncbi:MAG: hypothetical protein ACM3PY_19045 [Omnitrophica WOR_2 bacterium]